jgi:tetratricopeptide (TPR) repeat protein
VHRPSLLTLNLLLALAALADNATAQQVAIRVGGALRMTPEPAQQGDDAGQPVEMFESPNLDRFLRRARQFLQEEKYQEAILVLQTVIEGRTLEAGGEDRGGGGDKPGEKPADQPAGKPADQPGNKPAGRPGEPQSRDPRDARTDRTASLADPAQTVFSSDGRIYRPARRLCHEYLSGMPEVGIELYRSMFEGLAQDLLQQAQRTGLVSDLERVANRYFPTLAAGRAMQMLADRQMHEGRYRAAVQVLRDLAELYPRANQQQLGISQLWCRFKIALCLRLAGELEAALDAARELAAAYPDESLRVMGELQAVRDLPTSPLFATGDDALVAAIGTAQPSSALEWLQSDTEELVPLWQYRFMGGDPYEQKASSQQDRNPDFFNGEGVTVSATPPPNKYGTGAQLAFFGRGAPPPRIAYLENYRLRIADAFTGIVQQEGDGEAMPGDPRPMRARARVPVYDFSLLTPVEDDERYYVILGRSKIQQGIESLKSNTVVAYDKQTSERVWASEAFLEGEDGLADVTFLAAPTVFGERLLLPVLRRGAYELQCLDRKSGRPLWRTRIHGGGSAWFKAPGARVEVAGSLAYVLTNAGGVAAVDAFAGDLRWIRKYERTDPLRQKPLGRGSASQVANMGMQPVYFERDLPSFLPSDVIVVGGTLVFAGCDSDMVLCVDGASGEPVWMIDGATRYAPYRIRYLVGHNDKYVYAGADGADGQSWLVCIEHAGGLLCWAKTVPGGSERLTRWRGRGCVLANWVCMPGDREVHVIDAEGRGEWRRLSLPSFGVGDEPLRGPNNLYADGPWLGVAYTRGLEVYSTAAALRALAQNTSDPRRRAAVLVQAGDPTGAIAVLEQLLAQPSLTPEQRQAAETDVIGLARERALAGDGVAVLDRITPVVTTRQSRMAWRLARLDLFRQSGQLRAYEDEQQRLYRLMEGKD